MFSHPMPLGIGYPFHGFVDVRCHRARGVGYLVSLFLSYPMSIGIREVAHWQSPGFRGTVDERTPGRF